MASLKPVVVSLHDLERDAVPLSALEEAFGPSSLGIIIVKDLPAHYIELRRQVLSYSSYLANIPEDELAKLERPEGKYLTGWSMGKESLKPGVPDTLKGSYYINCAFAVSPELQCAPETRPSSNQETVGKDYSAFTEYTTPNAWPEEDVLPGFPERTEELCKLIVETAGLVARACDRFAIENVEDYTPGYLEEMVKGSMTTKGRLLHYFPSANRSDASEAETNGTAMEEAIQKADSSRDTDKAEDDWCATHTDHGCLTGLTSAMYVDETAHPPHFFSTSVSLSDAAHCESKRPSLPPLPELPMPPDHKTGLYIHSRSGAVTKVSIPKDCLAFQTGEALERITRGRFRAVPHFVRGVTPSKDNKLPGRKIARNTLAVFTQPNLWEMVDTEKGQDYAAFAREVVGSHY